MLKQNPKSANEAYRMYLGMNADGQSKLSFKDWLADQKERGNVDQSGKLLLDELFNKSSETNSNQTVGTNNNPPSNNPLPAKEPIKFLGMNPFISVPLVIGAIWGISVLIKHFSKPKAA